MQSEYQSVLQVRGRNIRFSFFICAVDFSINCENFALMVQTLKGRFHLSVKLFLVEKTFKAVLVDCSSIPSEAAGSNQDPSKLTKE